MVQHHKRAMFMGIELLYLVLLYLCTYTGGTCTCIYTCTCTILLQNSNVKFPNEVQTYRLTGVVTYGRAGNAPHYMAFVRSMKDCNQWFVANDSQVNTWYQLWPSSDVQKHNNYTMQVVPVSLATVLMQEPTMLFYEQKPGIVTYMYIIHVSIYSVIITLISEYQLLLSLHECERLRGSWWLDDQVHMHTLYITRTMLSNNSGYKHNVSLFFNKPLDNWDLHVTHSTGSSQGIHCKCILHRVYMYIMWLFCMLARKGLYSALSSSASICKKATQESLLGIERYVYMYM